MTDLKALAASIRVIGDELITISDLIYSPPTVQAEPAQDPNQAFQQPPAQQTAPPAQQPPVQQSPVQQQARAYTPPPQQQTVPSVQQPPVQQPPVQQQQPPVQQQAAPPVQQPPADDGFRAFSDQLIQLGRQAGPQGLGPIMTIVMPKYAPGAQGIAQVPPHNREPLLAEIRAYVAQQQAGGQQ